MYAPPPNGIKWSIAVIRDTEDKIMGAFPVGGKIHDATVTEHRRDPRLPRQRGQARVPRPVRRARAAAAAGRRRRAAPAKDDALAAELDKGIKKISEHKLRGPARHARVGAGQHGAALALGAHRARDEGRQGGRVPPVRVRPDGPFAMIGMQNGDIISSINGLEMTSPDKALEVYTKLKSASHLSLGIERNGQKVTKDYNIR